MHCEFGLHTLFAPNVQFVAHSVQEVLFEHVKQPTGHFTHFAWRLLTIVVLKVLIYVVFFTKLIPLITDP